MAPEYRCVVSSDATILGISAPETLRDLVERLQLAMCMNIVSNRNTTGVRMVSFTNLPALNDIVTPSAISMFVQKNTGEV
ncbi:MAG: hypothetical protein LQ344_004829 [Seirophora lacunosa]|nr:MAG: hypothetical protein LQ344_004829 [Seirophora lacunosa]